MGMNYGRIVKKDNVLGIIVKGVKKEFRFLPYGFGRYYTEELEIITEDNVKDSDKKDIIEYIEKEFPWGEIVATHIIGDYIIIECIPAYNKTSNRFSPYIIDMNNHTCDNTHQSYESLDEAIIGVIAYKYDGSNSQAAKFFGKMIGINNN